MSQIDPILEPSPGLSPAQIEQGRRWQLARQEAGLRREQVCVAHVQLTPAKRVAFLRLDVNFSVSRLREIEEQGAIVTSEEIYAAAHLYGASAAYLWGDPLKPMQSGLALKGEAAAGMGRMWEVRNCVSVSFPKPPEGT